mgnify:CR=1 FL=1
MKTNKEIIEKNDYEGLREKIQNREVTYILIKDNQQHINVLKGTQEAGEDEWIKYEIDYENDMVEVESFGRHNCVEYYDEVFELQKDINEIIDINANDKESLMYIKEKGEEQYIICEIH